MHKLYTVNDGLFVFVSTSETLVDFREIINPNKTIFQEFLNYNLFHFILIIDGRLYQINLFKLTIEDLTENTNYPDILKSWKKNLYGHQLKILYYNDPPMSYLKDNKIIGKDGYILDIICNKLNATCLITNKNNSKYKRKSEWIKYDIQFNLQSLYRPKYESDNIKMLYPSELDNICVLIAEDIKPYKFDIFSSKLIKCIYLVSVAFAIVVWYLFLKLRRIPITILDMILNCLRIVSVQPIAGKLKFGLEKFIVVLLSLATMIVYECYLKHFTSQLIIPSYTSNINTVSELNSSNFKIYVTLNTFDLLNNTYFTDQYFLKKFTSSNYLPENRLHSGRKSDIEGFAMYKSVAKLFLKNKIQKNKNSFYLMKECLVYSPSSYSVENNMAFTNEMDNIIMLLREAGLQHFWNILYERNVFEDNFVDTSIFGNVRHFDDYNRTMLYKDLSVAFSLLILLHFFSFVVFIVELLSTKYIL